MEPKNRSEAQRWDGREQRLPLLPDEYVLGSYRVPEGTLHATNRRLLLVQRRFRVDSFSDLSYGEITSVSLDVQGREASKLTWGGLLLAGAAVVLTLSRQVNQSLVLPVLILAALVGVIGLLFFVAFVTIRQRYLLEGSGLLRDPQHAARWLVPVRDRTEAAAFVGLVRDQVLQRETTAQELKRLREDLSEVLRAAGALSPASPPPQLHPDPVLPPQEAPPTLPPTSPEGPAGGGGPAR